MNCSKQNRKPIQLNDLEFSLILSFRQLNSEGQKLMKDTATGLVASGKFDKKIISLNCLRNK